MSLPSEFSALEPYLDWDLATEPERYAKRLASTMARDARVLRRRVPVAERRDCVL